MVFVDFMNKIKKIILLSTLTLLFSSCQLGYYFRSAKNQIGMMSSRVSIEEALSNEKLTSEQKRKIELSQKARVYAFEKLQLKKTDNYNSYIDLSRPYVSWVVHAAERWEMKNFEWKYPIVGAMPYKGFFTEKEAQDEALIMNDKGYDTYVRGVSAYSTLGWFTDSLLSSMLRYKDHDLVNTIIHEITHTTLYVKNNSDFNERLAVFIGNKGTEMFYKDLEGADSATLKTIAAENEDDILFSNFISEELKDLDQWYKENSSVRNNEAREQRLQQVYQNFETKLKPQLKTNSYNKFTKEKMNNAYLGVYKTYMQNLNDFEDAYKRHGSDLLKFIEAVKALESSKNPEEDLKRI